ncbi:GAF domain-containing protein [Tateyamaria sp. SN6-1]|uniref:GAF domain-containing protein n=1 Tax=Tateyamaria sp. SN6-1 TaxID=3092148 RepID=UPI0039F53BEE
MLDANDAGVRTFVEVAEVWVPKDGVLVWDSGDYGDLAGFKAVSGAERFAKGEGLPGKAWAEGRPIVLKGFEGSYFKRTKAAQEAGLTAAVAIPVFNGDTLLAVLVTLCSDDATRMGAIEVWRETQGILQLEDGYFGAAQDFEWVSRQAEFLKGQGMPGGVWAAGAPMLMRNLGAGHGFVRASSAEQAGISTGLGLPIPVPGDAAYVLALLSAQGTPLARRFEIWDARKSKVGHRGGAILIDGVCSTDGPLGMEDEPIRVAPYRTAIGQTVATGIPKAARQEVGLPGGHTSVVTFPIHSGGALSHIVAWYS